MKVLGYLALVTASWIVMAPATSGAQNAVPPGKAATPSVQALEKTFFAALRSGDSAKVLSFVPDHGVNLGSEMQHVSHKEVEQQFQSHRGLFCKLFDSSCLDAAVNLGNSLRTCSDRELLTESDKVRVASSEVNRSGVQQAVLVAEVKNDRCSNSGLIDFIFNFESDGWKLFSIP